MLLIILSSILWTMWVNNFLNVLEDIFLGESHRIKEDDGSYPYEEIRKKYS